VNILKTGSSTSWLQTGSSVSWLQTGSSVRLPQSECRQNSGETYQSLSIQNSTVVLLTFKKESSEKKQSESVQ
jgi:hypothetical protein